MGGTPFFVMVAATGLSVCFAFAIFAPLLHGLRLLGGRVALRLRRRTVARAVLRLRDDPLQPGLSAAHRRLAGDTRSLLASLEHACAEAYRWSDRPAGRWWQQIFASGSDVAYAPTIGMTGEVWHWLQQAEAIADGDDEPLGKSLQSATAAVRCVLFDERPLIERLETLVVLVAQVDDSLRIQSGSPYRDALASKAPSRTEAAAVPDGSRSEGVRRRRYHKAMRSHGGAIRAIVRRFSDPPEHDDLLQEIHLAIWNALPGYRGDCSLRTYVLRIARYRGITFKERRVPLSAERRWTDHASAPDELLDEKRQCLAVGRAIQQLPAKLRLALQLRLEGFSYREIAERLAITEKNASVRVSRARKTVKRYFGAQAG
jgi:RNA polymerase sigma-70 factor (ECF subfamily)